ncbi:cuscuta receptor 1-like isoform X2 [Actinidia eriantha]|uniref:cuscuta receptor 1-like isoform X2 n=1 Tax=Actinidia eriantha TaxID=165200 RepID=UPI00258C1BBE|nr:cuscuta receptor 1-like isoform X2 [Actinidia eriantha]
MSSLVTNMRNSLWWLWAVMVLALVKGWFCLGCLEQERIALLQLKANINYPNGNSLPSWVERENVNCCKWESVECNSTTGQVTQLSLNSTRDYDILESWHFNASLFLPFKELKTLFLSDNFLAGWIENEGFERLSALRNLKVLDLSGNRLNNSVLSSLSALSSLKYLDLGGNDLKGLDHFNSSEKLSGLSNLEILSLGGNQLNISIQSFLKLDDFVSLKELDLSYNYIEVFEPIQGLEILRLSGNSLNNSILASLRGFSTLKSLDLSGNLLTGSIHVQELDAFRNLEELDLSANEIESFVNPEGVKSLEKLKVLHLNSINNPSNLTKSLMALSSSLKTLYFTDSELKGEFRTEGLGNLSNLEELILDGTSLDKNFLPSIGMFTSLKTLSLWRCSLNGTLPNQGWCELKNLQELYLSSNQLEGTLPPCLGNLTYLRLFDVSDNQLTGNIASSPLSILMSLEYLSLSNNDFQVPVSFKSFANHSNLKVIFCDDNILTGENDSYTWAPKFQLRAFMFPSWTRNNSMAALPNFLYYQHDLRIIDLSHTKLSGTFPNWLLENNTRLEGIYLSDTSLVWPLKLPPHHHHNLLDIDVSNNKIGGMVPPNISSTFPNLMLLRMSGNEFDGNLISLFHDMNALEYVDLSNNLLSGVMPNYFITRCPSLQVIRLSNNNLSGKISPTTFDLPGLRHLYLDGNNFVGNIPNNLSFMPLRILDVSDNNFSGEIPRWVGNMKYVRNIIMSKNHFQGSFPIEFCSLNNLRFLDLSENNLSGSIPSCFNPPFLQHVHLYKNRFGGPLTNAFFNISNLITLDLRENYFTGRIPTWISSLSSLSFLLLKDNKFNGNIPSALCRCQKLTILDLSQNNLSGSLPPCLGNTFPFKVSMADYVAYGFGIPELKVTNYYMGFFQHEVRIKLFEKEEVDFTTKRHVHSYKGSILQIMSGIDFSCNQLTGEIPSEIGNLSNIHALNLSHNNFTGPIPTTFSNLKQVESLDLSYNNLNGQIPSQLSALNFLADFSVAHNNLSGRTPDQKGQFGTFNESSYEGNPLLCGPPLQNNCNKIEIQSPKPNASSQEVVEDGFIDMGAFYGSFVVSYVTVLLGILVVLYINPRWRRAWFYLIEVCIKESYYFVVDNFLKLFKCKNL